MITGTLLAFFHSQVLAKVPHPAASGLTFAERVAYQRGIEEVYWRHRIWPKENANPKPSLDAMLSHAQLEQKVGAYLRTSQELEDHWQRPITREQLQAEMDRMAQHSKQPRLLREIFHTLGDDPAVIAECLARPVLAERMITELNNEDRGTVTKAALTTAGKTASYTLPAIAVPSGTCTDDTWTPTSTTNAPDARERHAAVWTGSEMIVWGGLGASNSITEKTYDWKGRELNTEGKYNPRGKFSPTPTPTATPNPYLNTGARYSPSTDSWTDMSTDNAPDGRSFPTAVWTGSEMIIWGGYPNFNTGGRYNPSTDSWTATSTINTPSGRYFHTAVWTGSEMVVWGGEAQGVFDTGGRYNPSTDTWTATSTTNAPSARFHHTAVWTGGEMVVWGGKDLSSWFNTGGRYSASTNTWTSTSTANAPTARAVHTVVWTGAEMIAWGGINNGTVFNTGGRYNPSTDSWIATSTSNAPDGRWLHTAVWSGSEMIAWGGSGNSQSMSTGARYCAQSSSPTPTATATVSTTPSPTPTSSPISTATPTATVRPTVTPTPTPTPRLNPTPHSRPSPAPRP